MTTATRRAGSGRGRAGPGGSRRRARRRASRRHRAADPAQGDDDRESATKIMPRRRGRAPRRCAGRATSTTRPATSPPTPMPRFSSRKLMPNDPLPLVLGDGSREQGGRGRPEAGAAQREQGRRRRTPARARARTPSYARTRPRRSRPNSMTGRGPTWSMNHPPIGVRPRSRTAPTRPGPARRSPSTSRGPARGRRRGTAAPARCPGAAERERRRRAPATAGRGPRRGLGAVPCAGRGRGGASR